MPVALPGAVGASELTLLQSPLCDRPGLAAGAVVPGVLGCAATPCPGTAPGSAVLQEQELWSSAGQGPREGGCVWAAEQPEPLGALRPSLGPGRDTRPLLSEGLGVEGHLGGSVLLPQESVTA